MILLFDTETTGLDTPHAVEVAAAIIKNINNVYDIKMIEDRCRPPIPIEIKAMSVHNITNEMAEKCKRIQDTGVYATIMSCNTPDNIFVAHNAKFDLQVLKNAGLECEAKVIDTYKCCRKFFMDMPDVDKNLPFLKYYLKLYLEDIPSPLLPYVGQAHGAAADVVTLYLLFRRMAAKHTLDELLEITANPLLFTNMPYGKHKGRSIKDLVMYDKGYTNWVYGNIDDEDILYSFKHWSE